MASRRNHYVPQFLLRRFASRGNRKRHWVWQFRSGANPAEVVTKDAAVSTYFYGQPKTGVEGGLADLEGKHATLLRDLDSGTDPNDRAQELRVFVWSLAFRTRALRGQFANTAQRAIEQMSVVEAKTMAEAFDREITNNFDHHLDVLLGSLPAAQQAAIRQVLTQEGASEEAQNFARAEMAKFLPMARAMLKEVSGAMPDAAESGHVRAMIKLFVEGKYVPDKFEGPSWTIERFEQSSVVLGDGLVFSVGPDGDRAALGRFTNNYTALYAPIAHDRVLVGKRAHAVKTLGLDEINLTSVQLSLDTFFASRRTDAEVRLIGEIGAGDPILSAEELARIAHDSWNSLGRPRSESYG